MFGLMLKDLYTLKRTFSTMILLYAFYLILGIVGDTGGTFIAFMAAVMPMMAISSFFYDDMTKWQTYALALPLTRKQTVASKYLLVVVLMAFASVIALIINFIFSLMGKGDFGTDAVLLAAFCAVGLLYTSVVMPLIYRFGVEKARIIMILCGAGLGGVVGATIPFISSKNSSWITGHLQPLALGALAVVAVWVVISYFLSVHISEKGKG